MTPLKLQIKYGSYEFSAEGAEETVQNSLKTFIRLVSQQNIVTADAVDGPARVAYEKLFRIRGRIVSLVVPAKIEDAALLILFAQRQLAGKTRVTGGEIMSGLRASGLPIRRGDYLMKKHAADGYLVTNGRNRALTYGLTKTGVDKAMQAARYLLPLLGAK